VGHLACMEEIRNAYKILDGNTDRKRPFGLPVHKWEDNIRLELREIGWEVGKVQTGFMWFKIGAIGGSLGTQ